ncbi:hypothetical protein [Umezawaea tangerina]|uniref:Uncharacterized protein n=1 Tax=Umezawaea tangerina TaxID=84725 RepID=A0A2T0TL64_9PSEU|nr:hypothetical protein [Umezawaea tangerina]PRY46454.1 hypothetical protein CLV43_101730 [Umezawaea tangerina]
MHYVLFVVSALTGIAGCALLRWSASRRPPAAPVVAPEPTAEPTPPPPAERSLFSRPLRITILVERPGHEPEAGGVGTLTLPTEPLLAVGDDKPSKTTDYLVEAIEVEVNDFFDGFTAVAQRATGDASDCDVVVRGDGSHASNSSRRVVTRATMPIAVLMDHAPALVDECARALADPSRRRGFEEQVAAAVAEGGVLRWLEQHEQALSDHDDDPQATTPKPPWAPERPKGLPDQRKWPFVFEQQKVDEQAHPT